MKKRIYISGPIAGHDIEERREAFSFVETMLESFGLEVVNPLKNGLPEDCTHEQYMRVDIALLIGCDYIYLMKGWDSSRGASTEFVVATSAGIEVYANENYLNDKNEELVLVEASVNISMWFTPGSHFDEVKDYIDRMQEE